MRTVYQISRQRFLTEEKRAEFAKRFRSDSAAKELWSQIYNMLDSNGLRDRPIAHKLAAQFDACEISPPPLGYLRREIFKLDDYQQVELYITREF